MKTEKRMSDPGGNVHYERFKEEIIQPLQNEIPTVHRPYNCQKKALDNPIQTAFFIHSIIRVIGRAAPARNSPFTWTVLISNLTTTFNLKLT
ncbi:hypothetical protein CHI07_09555 [Paenibacillus sp. 7884-2]|nr:hypothetical protein CHI07_09555 [Paenibacillus sp. 7884-2]